MAFVFQKVSNHGTANPIVARLSMQTAEIANWIGTDKQLQQRVTDLYIGSLQPRLLNCFDALAAIETKLSDSTQQVEQARQKDPRLREIPYVEALDGHVQAFLVDAKSYLRDLISLFEIVDGYLKVKNGKPVANEGSDFADYSGAGLSLISEWAVEKFGEQTPLADYLISSQPWITELISMRNANEHPGGKAGTLGVNNVRVNNGCLVAPTWWRIDGNGGAVLYEDPIIEGMKQYIEALLQFGGTLALDAAIRSLGGSFVDEIPEAERNPVMPVRFRINHDVLMSLVIARMKKEKGV
jgi:hypothetical protein